MIALGGEAHFCGNDEIWSSERQLHPQELGANAWRESFCLFPIVSDKRTVSNFSLYQGNVGISTNYLAVREHAVKMKIAIACKIEL